jgi:hypothetical protein
MNTIEVLRYGAQVRLASVDMYGYWGRENHPEADDVGFIGVVVGNIVCGPAGVRQNVLGGTELSFDEENEAIDVCYQVRASDGRELDLMDHEIEAF